MKKVVAILMGVVILMSSCATLTNRGPVTASQRTKPAKGEPKREIRTGALLADVFLLGLIPLLIDFGTHAIYKKAPGEQTEKKK